MNNMYNLLCNKYNRLYKNVYGELLNRVSIKSLVWKGKGYRNAVFGVYSFTLMTTWNPLWH